MKKILLMALALIPLSVFAQNRSVEELAAKYADREGFSTTVIRGDISSGFSETLNMKGINISKIIKDISSITIVRAETADAGFTQDVKRTVASGGYSTVMSTSADGERIEFLLAEISEGRRRKNEFVIVILGRTENMLVSIVGNYNIKQVSKTEN